MGDIEKNIKAVEEEKKEYLEGNSKEASEKNEEKETGETEVEVTEISLNDIEIQEWIAKLQLLKESKEPINLEIDDETELLINYEENDLEEEM